LSDFGDALGGYDRASLEMHLEAVIKRDWRFIRRPKSNHSEMHLEAVIERVRRCTSQPRSSEFGAALGGCNRVNTKMHLVSPIGRVWRYIWSL